MRIRFGTSTPIAACLAMGIACSLIDRPSDYFDPNGSLVTLAQKINAQDLVLTEPGVFYRVDDTIYRVPKVGGVPRVIHAGTSVETLVSDRHGRVAWIESAGVYLWDEGDVDARLVPNTRGAEHVSVTSSRAAVSLPLPDENGGRAVQILGPDSMVRSASLKATVAPASILLADARELYFASAGLARESRAGDDPQLVFSDAGTLGYCHIDSFSQIGLVPNELIVDHLTDGTLVALVVGARGLTLFTGDTCCREQLEAGSCPRSAPILIDTGRDTVAIRGNSIYRLNGSQLERYDIDSLRTADGGIPVPEIVAKNFPGNPRYLALDTTTNDAFFITDDRIQRLKLPSAP